MERVKLSIAPRKCIFYKTVAALPHLLNWSIKFSFFAGTKDDQEDPYWSIRFSRITPLLQRST